MEEQIFENVTQEEMSIRASAVEYAFRDNNIKAAVDVLMRMAQNNPILFKFYRPKEHSIRALKESKIFMCRPSSYDDIGDNEYLPDVKSIFKLYVEEKRKSSIPFSLLSNNFYDEIVGKIEKNPKFICHKESVRDDFLTACITENFNEKMWNEYAQNGEGFCVAYKTEQLIAESGKFGCFFYPVRYVSGRKSCKDIIFSADEYGDSEQFYNSYVKKAYLSCLTKEISYSSERKWRVICHNSGVLGKGKQIPFVKPFVIIAGDNIGNNPDIEESLIDTSKQLGVKLIGSKDYNKS